MNRQFKNAVTSVVITALAGIGLAFGQDPYYPQPVNPAQTVQQTVQQPVQQPVQQQLEKPVEQTIEKPVEQMPVQTVEQMPEQTTTCQPVCADLCELLDRIEDYADDLRKDFKRSVRDLDCVDDSYYESVKAFERATDRLERDFRDNCDPCAITAQVQEVLSLAHCISAYMDPCSLCSDAISAWGGLQTDLQVLAGQFCTTAVFQQPVSLAPQPACFTQPVQVVQPVSSPVNVIEQKVIEQTEEKSYK